MTPEELSFKVIGAAYKVHNELGPGLLERIYEQAMLIQLQEDGLRVQSQVPIPVVFHGYNLGEGCRLDLVVEDTLRARSTIYVNTGVAYLGGILCL